MMNEGLFGVLANGNLAISIVVVVAAGFISFASPCVLPLVPGYLAFVGGFTGGAERQDRRRIGLGISLFVLGFSVIYVTFGLLASVAGALLIPWIGPITRAAGLVIVILGLVFIGQFKVLQRTIKPEWKVRTGIAGAPFLGMVFALGWTPCIGPALSVVITLSLNEASAWRGVILGACFCVGLGIPFILIGLGLNWVGSSVRWLKAHIRAINIVGGASLVAIGLLMMTGLWMPLVSWLGSLLPGVSLPI